MLQVRAHGARGSAYSSYAAKLHTFYLLQCRQAAAYSLYAATTTFLPSVVVAVVLFYGGTLVLNNQVCVERVLVGWLVGWMSEEFCFCCTAVSRQVLQLLMGLRVG